MALILITALGVSLLAKLATDRGRSALMWGAAAIAGSLLGFTVFAALGANPDPFTNGLPLFAMLAVPVGGVLPMLGIGIILSRLPISAGRTSTGRWPMYRLFDGAQDGYPCTVVLGDRTLEVVAEQPAKRLLISRNLIKTVAADGEVLRITWWTARTEVGEVLLMAQRGSRPPEWARAFVSKLAASVAPEPLDDGR